MTPEDAMNEERLEIEPSSESSGFDPRDIYYVLFRHKWKIILFSLAGVLAAAGLYFMATPSYQSTAKLMIPYVLERTPRPLNPAENDPQISSTDPAGMLSTELEILRSFDLASAVADLVG